MKRILKIIIPLLLGATVTWPVSPSAQTRVFLGEDEAIARALHDHDNVRADTLRLSPVEIKALAGDLGGVIVDSIYVFHAAVIGEGVSRRAIIVSSMGQYQPITFVVALGGDGDVERVEIMVYRESRGGEVRRRAFLEQFEGKGVDDAVRIGDDVRHVTGATISSRAVADGVHLALRLQRLLLSRDKARLPAHADSRVPGTREGTDAHRSAKSR